MKQNNTNNNNSHKDNKEHRDTDGKIRTKQDIGGRFSGLDSS